MKLAALGVVTVGIGIASTIPGLLAIGAFWILMGLVARAYRLRLERATHDAPAGESATSTTRRRLATDGSTFALGTVLWLAIGIPSIAVGAFGIGIGADDTGWRWLPIVVGALALVIGVLGGLLYGAGSAATAVEGTPDKPASLWIRSVKETGTFVNERPRLAFEFHVEPDETTGLTAYDVTKKATVPFTAVGSLRVGDGFKGLVVGPEKPTSMEIDWTSPIAAPAPLGSPVDAGPPMPGVAERLEELDRLRREATISDEEYQAQRQRILDSL